MADIKIVNESKGIINFIPGCDGSINLVSLCGCEVDLQCPSS
jgi:hypothetical protein